MHEYRVSKYDPKNRDEYGRYLLDEWTSIFDIDRQFSGIILTQEMYQKVENAYLDTAMEFILESRVDIMHIKYSPNEISVPDKYKIGQAVQLNEIRDIICSLLREEYWCKLEAPDGTYISVGYDFLMFLGSPSSGKIWQKNATNAGVFIEKIPLPYKSIY